MRCQQEMGKVSIDVLLVAGLFCLAIGEIELTYTGKDQFARRLTFCKARKNSVPTGCLLKDKSTTRGEVVNQEH